MSREEKKLSGAMRLFEALSGVDEELLAKADDHMQEAPVSEKRKMLAFPGSKTRLAVSLAAAASFLLVVGAVWTGMPMLNGKKSADTAVETAMEMTTSTTTSGVTKDAEVLADEAFEEVTVENEAIKKEAATEDTAGVAGSTAGDKIVDKSEAKSEIEKESDGTVADTGDRQHNSGGQESQKHTQQVESQKSDVENKDSLGREDGAITEFVGSTPLDERVELSESQARSVEGLGTYIPAKLPAGYTWESAKAVANDETGAYESIFLCWTKGMDSIMITVSVVDAESIILADIAKKETYDVSLYDIPYAETVPEEYRQSFEDPIFAAEELSLELVQSRM